MGKKHTITSLSIDRHGDLFTEEVLNKTVEAINGTQKMRFLINHRRDLPPLGYWDNAELTTKENTLCVDAETIVFTQPNNVEWDTQLLITSANHDVPLMETENVGEKLVVSFDKNNFEVINDMELIARDLVNISPDKVEFEAHSRKGFLPDLEIIIKISKALLLCTALKPFIKKVGERFAEDVADTAYDYSKKKLHELKTFIVTAIKGVKLKAVPKDATLVTIFEIPSYPYLELCAKSNNAELVAEAVTSERLEDVNREIERLSKFIKMKEIHFVLTDEGNWQLTYLITEQDQIIGTKVAFQERDNLYRQILESPTSSFSLSGGNVKYQRASKGESKKKD